jgi:hypothetical protein
MHIAVPVGCALSGRTFSNTSPRTVLIVPHLDRHSVQYPFLSCVSIMIPLPPFMTGCYEAEIALPNSYFMPRDI